MGMLWLLLTSVFARGMILSSSQIITTEKNKEAIRADTAIPVLGYSGGRVDFQCSIPVRRSSDLPKYLCRESDSGCTNLIRTERVRERETSGRFSYFDTGFELMFVIFRELTRLDSAIYRCGVEERTGSDTFFNRFNLTVTEAGQRSVQQNGHVGGNVSFTCSYLDEHRDSKKSFCRDEGGTHCWDMVSLQPNQMSTTLDRFSMVDHPTQNFLTVNISNLTVWYTGSYWCYYGKNLGQYIEGDVITYTAYYQSYTTQLLLTVTD